MIVITAAAGQLGRLVLDALIARGVPAEEIVAGVRFPRTPVPRARVPRGNVAVDAP